MRNHGTEDSGHPRRRRRRAGRRRSSGPSDTQKIREWAREQGLEVSERGRVSAEVRKAYYEANPNN